jgi:hypothetical protein
MNRSMNRLTASFFASQLLFPAAACAHALTPPEAKDGRVEVKVGMYVENLVEVDELRQLFRVREYLRAVWNDPRLAYAARPREAAREFKPDQLWVPDLYLANCSGQRTKIGVNIKVRPDGTVEYLEDLQAELTMEMNYQKFPFDRQALPIAVRPFLDERDTFTLIPDPSQSGIETQPWALLTQWKILSLTASARQAPLSISRDGIPEIEFDLNLARKHMFYVWKDFLPLFIMLLISYSMSWLRIADHNAQLQGTLTATLTMVAFMFVISGSLPRISYLTYIDAFFLVGFLFAFLAILEAVVIHRLLEAKDAARAVRLRLIYRAGCSHWLI